jgi:hypothetical protein
LSILRTQDQVQPIEKAAAQLQLQVESLRVEKKQERFFWAMSLIASINLFVAHTSAWSVSLVFLTFSIIFLVGFAKVCEVPWVVTHLERWLDRTARPRGEKETE